MAKGSDPGSDPIRRRPRRDVGCRIPGTPRKSLNKSAVKPAGSRIALHSPIAMGTAAEGKRIRIRGTVQGVGFRPWVYRVALQTGIRGRVRNDSSGVTIDAFGDEQALQRVRASLAPVAAAGRSHRRLRHRRHPFGSGCLVRHRTQRRRPLTGTSRFRQTSPPARPASPTSSIRAIDATDTRSPTAPTAGLDSRSPPTSPTTAPRRRWLRS